MAERFTLDELSHATLDDLDDLEAPKGPPPTAPDGRAWAAWLDYDEQSIVQLGQALLGLAVQQVVFVSHAAGSCAARLGAGEGKSDDEATRLEQQFLRLRTLALANDGPSHPALAIFACRSHCIRDIVGHGLGLRPNSAARAVLDQLPQLTELQTGPDMEVDGRSLAAHVDRWTAAAEAETSADLDDLLHFQLLSRSGAADVFRVAPLLRREPEFLERLEALIHDHASEAPPRPTENIAAPEGFTAEQTAAIHHSETLFAAWQGLRGDGSGLKLRRPPGADELQVHRPKPSIWNWVALAILLGLSAASYLGDCGAHNAEAPAGDS